MQTRLSGMGLLSSAGRSQVPSESRLGARGARGEWPAPHLNCGIFGTLMRGGGCLGQRAVDEGFWDFEARQARPAKRDDLLVIGLRGAGLESDGEMERLPALAADLVRLGVDIIVTANNPPT